MDDARRTPQFRRLRFGGFEANSNWANASFSTAKKIGLAVRF
jgi:hypothetical protein